MVTASARAQDYDEAAEQQLFQLVNQERAKAGAPELQWDERLHRAAREHAALMAQHKQLSHQFAGEPSLIKRLAAQGVRLNNDAENVALDDSPEGAHQGFMNSRGHRTNIMNPQYNAVGIAVVRQGNSLWITEDFAHQVQERSDAEAEKAVVAALERERKRANLPPAANLDAPRLRRLACGMARKGELDTSMPLTLPEVRATVVYTETEPEHLPASAVKCAHNRTFSRFAVGACFATDEKYPTGTFWVVVAFYI